MLKNYVLIGVTILSLFSIKSIFFTNDIKENTPNKIIYNTDNIKVKNSNFLDDIEEFEVLDENEEISKSSTIEKIGDMGSDIRLLFQDAETLIAEDKHKDAIEIYNKIISMTQNSTKVDILKYFAKANSLKGYIYKNFIHNRFKAIKAYDETVAKFKNSKNIELIKLYLTAQENKASLVDRDEAIYIYDEIINKLKNSDDTFLLQKFSLALKNKAFLLSNGEEVIEAYDTIIDKFGDTDNPTLLQELLDAQISKAFVLSTGGQNYDEVIEVYDEIIAKFDHYDGYEESVSDALFSKSYFVAKEDKERSMEILDTVIDRYKDVPDKLKSKNFEYAVINNIELALVTNSDDTRYRELANEYLLNISDTKPQMEMLEILKNAQDLDQTQAMSEWKKQYKDYQFENWSFETLDEWKDTIEDSEAKSRIEEYLSEFKKHNNG